MAGKVKAIPEGYHTVTPYLIVHDGNQAIDWYQRAFDASERMRYPMPGGKLGHAEVQIGDSRIMLADEFPEMGIRGPKTLGGSPVSILLYVEDVDVRVSLAIAAGAIVLRPLKNQFYGDRSATLADPFGHVWTIASHVEDLTPEEMKKREAAEYGK